MRGARVGLLILVILGCLGWTTVGHADVVVHDRAHLLSPAQRQEIVQANRTWQASKRKPQLWVYTYTKVPANLFFSGSDNDYADPFSTAGNDLVEQLFQRQANRETSYQGSDGDTEYAITHRATQLKKHVSVILVYPDGGWRTVISPSEDLSGTTSDMQKWWLTQRLPNKQGTAASAMTFFHRYQPYITKHVANAKHIQPGMDWGGLSFWVLFPFFLWLGIRLIRGLRHAKFDTSGRYNGYSGWDAYMFGRWMGGDHDNHWGHWW